MAFLGFDRPRAGVVSHGSPPCVAQERGVQVDRRTRVEDPSRWRCGLMEIRSFSGAHPWHPTVLLDTDAHDEGNAEEIIENIESGRCPRCEGPLPTLPEFPAGSRTTPCRSIPICGRCGGDEVYEQLGDGISSPGCWPLPVDEIDERRAFHESQATLGSYRATRSSLKTARRRSQTRAIPADGRSTDSEVNARDSAAAGITSRLGTRGRRPHRGVENAKGPGCHRGPTRSHPTPD
jgi:hypothetical protein